MEVFALMDEVRLRITDSGTWKPERTVPDFTRGRGIALMEGLTDFFDIQHEPTGTTVQLHARIET